MKRAFTKLDKLQLVIASVALPLLLLGLFYDNLMEAAFIFIFIGLLVNDVQDLNKDQKSNFLYLKIVMKILVIFLLLYMLLY